jgi:hypothetical protein
MLVNDLDMRFMGPSATTYSPWVLNAATPASAATTGDNIRDNVEVVFVQSPVIGQTYKIRITHKGTLSGGAQAYSLIVTGVTTNHPPVADAGPNQTIDCVLPTGIQVTFDGSGSYDVDGDPLTYTWSEGSTVLAGPTANASSTVSLLPGVHVITLTVDDGNGMTDTDMATITLNPDVVPPEITAPPALAEPNDEGECGKYLSSFTLGVPIASDDCALASVVNDAPSYFPVGVTVVTWTATDASGNSSTATQSVTILDVEPPKITASVAPDLLWPPNHKMVDITATVSVTDNCSADFVLYSITSNEPDNGLGDGDKPDDIQPGTSGDPRTQFMLRAERSGMGSGRVYTIKYMAMDDAENTAWATVSVVVPHNAPKSIAPVSAVPDAFALLKNRPDPFNPSTVISYRLPDDGHVRLAVYDYLGREIRVLADLFQQKGTHEVVFTARDETSGLYFYRLEWNGQVRTKKMLLVK